MTACISRSASPRISARARVAPDSGAIFHMALPQNAVPMAAANARWLIPRSARTSRTRSQTWEGIVSTLGLPESSVAGPVLCRQRHSIS